jgi:hypothetical protein
MSHRNVAPKWWQAYLTLPLLIALFAVETRLRISQRGHQAVQIGIILLVYGLIHLWLKANAGALSQMDRKQHDKTIRIVRTPAPKLPESRREKRSILQLSDGEIQGLLSDAMDMSYTEAESSRLDDLRRN